MTRGGESAIFHVSTNVETGYSSKRQNRTPLCALGGSDDDINQSKLGFLYFTLYVLHE
jgi:hypothetical protein